MNFITYQYSCQGNRNRNEDLAGYQITKRGGLWALADGLGGHVRSEEASRLIIRYLLKKYEENGTIDLTNAFYEANNRILELQTSNNVNYCNAATTIVAAFIENEKFCCAHIGDSRLYYFRNCEIIHQTKDHSVAQVAVDLGEISKMQQRTNLDRNRLLRAVGTAKEVKADILDKSIMVKSGDAFLLCSDGFWEWIYETEMEIDLCKSPSPRAWTDYMLCRVRRRQKEEVDNYTVQCCMIT